ncbi:Exodeoxyribonuclease VII large subunit [Staphylococcus aureus]|nr:Exodeoxyribonuclease VII large subunit [Staphylococcus aureus]
MSQTTCLINEVLCGYKILKITQAISITLKALLSSVNQEQQNNLQLTNQLVKLLNSKILSYKNDLKNKVENLNNLSPTNTMLRGYAIVNKKDEVITSTKDLTENDQLTLTMKDGLVDAKVTKVRCNND